MIEQYLSPIEKWQANFEQHPLEAVDRLLIGRAYMGRLNRNDTDEILFRLFHTATKDRLTALDKAMWSWFARYWGSAPPAVPAARWGEILQNAFSAVIRLNLRETQAGLLENHARARVWLRSSYLGPARDPEADLLRTLALCQHNQDLLPLWMRLCRLEEDRPLHFASVGLLGLRKLPDENGEPHGDLHTAVFSGIVNLANAIDKQVRPKKEGEAFWFLKVRALMARYPRAMQYWTEHFLPVIYSAPSSPATKWLGKLIPRLSKALDGAVTGERIIRKPLRPPSRDEFGTIRELIKRHPLEEIRPKLDTFLREHERYALQTGDADILVKVFNEIAYKTLNQDPNWSLALVEKAFFWAPYNTYVWTERALIESYFGRYERAVQLLWEAKRKFPEDPYIRNILAKLLIRQGKEDIAEIVYRQTKEAFPNDEVCRNGLAEVLKDQGKLDDAAVVYRQTKEAFPNDKVCRNGLAGVLKDQRKLEDAAAEYRQTKEAFPNDEVCRNGLAGVLKDQRKLAEAEAEYCQTMEKFLEDDVCCIGLAVVWLLQGKQENAVRLLEETVKQFPNNPVTKDFLGKIKENQETPEVLAAEYDKFTVAMAKAEKIGSRHLDFIEPQDEPVTVPTQAAQAQDEEVGQPPKPETDLSQKEGRERTDAVVRKGTSAASSTSRVPAIEDGVIETQIGLANLYRLAARRAEGEERERYQREFVTACEKALDESSKNIFALLEKGFWMVDQEPKGAEIFFNGQIIDGKQPHVLGFRVGVLRAKIRQGEAVTAKQWKELMGEFPGRKTLITLENARQELLHTNGRTLSVLESLRKQVRTDAEVLPGILRGNEEWVRSTVTKGLFAEIDLARPLTEDILPLVKRNHAESDLVLQGVVEQSLTNI